MSDVAEKPREAFGDLEPVTVSESEEGCAHDNLDVSAQVVTIQQNGIPVDTNVRFLDVRCSCRSCGMPMRFRGTPYGVPCALGDEKWSDLLRAPFVGAKDEAQDEGFKLTVPQSMVLAFDQDKGLHDAPRTIDAPLAPIYEIPRTGPQPDGITVEHRMPEGGALDELQPIFDALGKKKRKEDLIENLYGLMPYLETPVSELKGSHLVDLKALTECLPPIMCVVDNHLERVPEGWKHWFGDYAGPGSDAWDSVGH